MLVTSNFFLSHNYVFNKLSFFRGFKSGVQIVKSKNTLLLTPTSAGLRRVLSGSLILNSPYPFSNPGIQSQFSSPSRKKALAFEQEIVAYLEKLLVTSIFPLSHHVLKSFLSQGCLTHSHTVTPFDAPGKQAF